MHGTKIMAIAALALATVAVAQQSPSPPAKTTAPTEATAPKAAVEAASPKATVEDLLTKALQQSPDIQVAEAKLREAEAQFRAAEAMLRQARLQTAQKVVETHIAQEKQQQLYSSAQADYQRIVKLHGAGTMSTTDVSAAESRLQELKGQLAQLEVRINALTGRLPGLAGHVGQMPSNEALFVPAKDSLGGAASEAPKRMPPQEMADRMRKALSQSIKISDGQVTLKDLVNQIRTQVPTVPFLFQLGDRMDESVKIDFKGELTLASCFQLLCDTLGLEIVVRDYGFMVTGQGQGPDDAISIIDFKSRR